MVGRGHELQRMGAVDHRNFGWNDKTMPHLSEALVSRSKSHSRA